MKKSFVIWSLIPVALGLVVIGLPSGLAAQQPNIVWVSCEDISPHLGCYGDAQATTPNIDRLAAEGVRYTHAFVTAGVCSPCRSTIITGMYQTTIGTQHMRSSARLPERIKPFTVSMRQAGYFCTNNSKTDYQFKAPRETWDQSSTSAHWRNRPRNDQPFFSVFNFTECHESGIADDKKYKRVTQGLRKHDPASLMTLPPYYPDTPGVRADWARYYDVIAAMDRRVGQIVKQLIEDGLYDETIVVFWSDHGVGLPRGKRWLYDSGMHVPLIVRVPDRWRRFAPGAPGTTTSRLVSLMDLGPSMLKLAGLTVPQHMQGIPFLGEELPAARTYVFGARDRMDERYDIIRAVRDHRFRYIRNYEPYKTYYQYMNTPEKGRLMQEIRRVAAEGKLPPAARLFMAREKPSEELYDTHADPHEIHNLAGDPQFQRELTRLRQAHLDWVLETKDLGLIPEPEIARREAIYGNRYDILRQTDAATLMQRVRDTAELSLPDSPAARAAAIPLGASAGRNTRRAARLDKLLMSTHDPDAAVRYWGAIGLGNITGGGSSRTERAGPSPEDQHVQRRQRIRERIERLLEDDSAVVRVAAARALCRRGSPDKALPVLANVLQQGAQWERLHAIIALDEIDEMARPVIRQMRAALQFRNDLVQSGKYTVRVANRALNELLGTDRSVR